MCQTVGMRFEIGVCKLFELRNYRSRMMYAPRRFGDGAANTLTGNGDRRKRRDFSPSYAPGLNCNRLHDRGRNTWGWHRSMSPARSTRVDGAPERLDTFSTEHQVKCGHTYR